MPVDPDAEIQTIRVILPVPLVTRITISLGGSGSGGGTWGSITGTLSDQTDLQSALDAKVDPFFSNPGGRITTESGVPVSTSDRTSQGTIYYTPYLHNNIYTYSGSAWVAKTFSEISLTLSVTSGKNYDVFINSAATTLSLSAAWNTDTSRTDAIGTQDGVTVLSSDHTKLWLGTIRASGSNVTEDSGGGITTQVGGKRFIWNAYNQVPRGISVIDTTANWSYATNGFRQADGASGNKVEYVTGSTFEQVSATITSMILVASTTHIASVGVGVDSTTTALGTRCGVSNSGAGGIIVALIADYSGTPGLGYHYLSWNESGAGGTSFFVGLSEDSQSGLIVTLLN